jgi:hypothetical protein
MKIRNANIYLLEEDLQTNNKSSVNSKRNSSNLKNIISIIKKDLGCALNFVRSIQ